MVWSKGTAMLVVLSARHQLFSILHILVLQYNLIFPNHMLASVSLYSFHQYKASVFQLTFS